MSLSMIIIIITIKSSFCARKRFYSCRGGGSQPLLSGFWGGALSGLGRPYWQTRLPHGTSSEGGADRPPGSAPSGCCVLSTGRQRSEQERPPDCPDGQACLCVTCPLPFHGNNTSTVTTSLALLPGEGREDLSAMAICVCNSCLLWLAAPVSLLPRVTAAFRPCSLCH